MSDPVVTCVAAPTATERERAQLVRLSLPPLRRYGRPVLTEKVDPRRFIRAAINLDVRSCWALQAYAEKGQSSDLAAALEISRGLNAALVAEAHRIGRHALAQVYTPRTGRG